MVDSRVLWTPSPERIERANVTRFARQRGLPVEYDSLWRWSVADLEEFWGAIWGSAAPEFGARSVIDRFAQIDPKVLLAIDGYRYGGKDFDCTPKVEQLTSELPGTRLVRLDYLDGSGWEDGFEQAGPLEFIR